MCQAGFLYRDIRWERKDYKITHTVFCVSKILLVLGLDNISSFSVGQSNMVVLYAMTSEISWTGNCTLVIHFHVLGGTSAEIKTCRCSRAHKYVDVSCWPLPKI